MGGAVLPPPICTAISWHGPISSSCQLFFNNIYTLTFHSLWQGHNPDFQKWGERGGAKKLQRRFNLMALHWCLYKAPVYLGAHGGGWVSDGGTQTPSPPGYATALRTSRFDCTHISLPLLLLFTAISIFHWDLKVLSYYNAFAMHCRTAPSCTEIVMILHCGVAILL